MSGTPSSFRSPLLPRVRLFLIGSEVKLVGAEPERADVAKGFRIPDVTCSDETAADGDLPRSPCSSTPPLRYWTSSRLMLG